MITFDYSEQIKEGFKWMDLVLLDSGAEAAAALI